MFALNRFSSIKIWTSARRRRKHKVFFSFISWKSFQCFSHTSKLANETKLLTLRYRESVYDLRRHEKTLQRWKLKFIVLRNWKLESAFDFYSFLEQRDVDRLITFYFFQKKLSVCRRTIKLANKLSCVEHTTSSSSNFRFLSWIGTVDTSPRWMRSRAR